MFDIIKYLRFPLIVMVVMIHAHMTEVSMGGVVYEFGLQSYPIYSNVSFFISDLISRIAVPCFFLFSGYLFFIKTQQFTSKEYFKKLKRRIRSLVIPYLFWNVVVIVFFFLLQTVIPTMASGSNKLIVDYTLADWIRAFWSVDNGRPICYPLWFIRDLFVIVLLSPLIYYAIKFLKVLWLIVMGVVWLFDIDAAIPGICVPGIFFFSLGSYYSLNSLDVIKDITRVRAMNYVFSLLLVAFEILIFNMQGVAILPGPLVPVVYNLCLFSLIVTCLNLVAAGIRANRLHVNEFLHSSNFFVYAFHAMPLALILKLLVKAIHPTADLQVVFIYLLAPFVTISVGLVVFSIMKKILPRFTALICGGRL